MPKSTKLPTIKRSEYLRSRLIPDLEKELASGGLRDGKERQDQENLLKNYKRQLKNIEDGTEQDNIFRDMVVDIDTKTGTKTERPRREDE